jgi:hypothetical protein
VDSATPRVGFRDFRAGLECQGGVGGDGRHLGATTGGSPGCVGVEPCRAPRWHRQALSSTADSTGRAPHQGRRPPSWGQSNRTYPDPLPRAGRRLAEATAPGEVESTHRCSLEHCRTPQNRARLSECPFGHHRQASSCRAPTGRHLSPSHPPRWGVSEGRPPHTRPSQGHPSDRTCL